MYSYLSLYPGPVARSSSDCCLLPERTAKGADESNGQAILGCYVSDVVFPMLVLGLSSTVIAVDRIVASSAGVDRCRGLRALTTGVFLLQGYQAANHSKLT